MSKLGKILICVALAGALAAAIAGGLLIEKRWEDAAILAKTQQDKAADEQTIVKDKAEAKALSDAKADSDAKLTTANSKIDDLNTQLKTAQKTADDAKTAVDAANSAAQTAKDALDAINKSLNGRKPEDYIADVKKAQDDLASAQSEQKILQDQLQASQAQITDLNDALNRSKTGKMPGISGRVTFVDHAWNFVIMDVGLASGVVPNGELIVYRGRTFLGKVKVTKVDPNDAVAEILPDAKGDIQVGDSVLN